MTRTLIVEDNDTFRQTLKNLLSPQFPFMWFEEARDRKEALEKITAFRPQLIFMDIKLPGESGLEITKEIRRSGCTDPIIILTSYDLPEYREAAMRYGANYFISKGSTTTKEILTLVDSIVSRLAQPEITATE